MKFRKMYNSCISLDTEQDIFDVFRTVPKEKIIYNGRFFKCLRVDRLLRSCLYKKNWIDSSKNTRPDFHNDKNQIMMDFMKIDDAQNLKNNSFRRKTKTLNNYFGNDYEELLKETSLFYVPRATEDCSYNNYLNNFKSILLKHSDKVCEYRKNFPNCKTCVLFVCDESSCYFTTKLTKNHKNKNALGELHKCFFDKAFIDIIRNCKADFVVWYTHFKQIVKGKKLVKQPVACIYDIQHLKQLGIQYSASSMQILK